MKPYQRLLGEFNRLSLAQHFRYDVRARCGKEPTGAALIIRAFPIGNKMFKYHVSVQYSQSYLIAQQYALRVHELTESHRYGRSLDS